MVRSRCFLSGPTKNFSLQNGEKIEGKKWGCLIDKNVLMHLHMGFVRTLLFSLFFFSFLLDVALFFPSSWTLSPIFFFLDLSVHCSYFFFSFAFFCVFFFLVVCHFFCFTWASFLTMVHE